MPSGTWHEPGVESDGTACIRYDGFDVPLINVMEAGFYVAHPSLQQDKKAPGSGGYPAWFCKVTTDCRLNGEVCAAIQY